MGANARHAQMRFARSGGALRAVAWNWGERVDALRAGIEGDALVRLKLNEWRGRVSAECELVDLRLRERASVGASAGLTRPSRCPS